MTNLSVSDSGVLPNFLVCGVAKAGTTSLYYYLNQHPEISMSPVKEVNYFSNHYAKGSDWYRSHFSECRGAAAIGEVSASYMTNRDAPRRIFDLIPEAKLLFILRNPVERAYSGYWYRVSLGAQDFRQSFSEAIRTDEGARRYIEPGFYMDHLEPFLARFGRSQVHTVLTEELSARPADVMGSCFRFLNVAPDFVPDSGEFHNVRRIPRGKLAGGMIRGWFYTRILLRSLVPMSVRRATKPVWRRLYRRLVTEGDVPPERAEDRAYLSGIYRLHNDRLSSFLGRDVREIWT